MCSNLDYMFDSHNTNIFVALGNSPRFLDEYVSGFSASILHGETPFYK